MYNILEGFFQLIFKLEKYLLLYVILFKIGSYICLLCVLVAQSCLTLCNPMFCTLWTVFSVHGILQARILEWVAIAFSRGSSRCRDWICIFHIAGWFFTIWATREALLSNKGIYYFNDEQLYSVNVRKIVKTLIERNRQTFFPKKSFCLLFWERKKYQDLGEDMDLLLH